jgi:hypothetical protein
MKKIFALALLIASLGLQMQSYGQSAVGITGTVKSDQGALQGATVSFLDLNDNFQGNCVSGPDGKFISQNKMPVGKAVKIRIAITGYQPFEKVIQIDRSGNAGEFMLQLKSLTISGFVRDSISEVPLAGVEVFFYDESRLIQSRSTNNQGYFEIETGYTYGQKITVRVSRVGYYDKEQTLIFTSEGRNVLQDILLPQLGDRGLRAFIRVRDKSKDKPMGGAAVRYFDAKRSIFVDTVVSALGELELKLYQRPGTTLDLQISKPGYVTIQAKATLSEDPLVNVFTYEMEHERHSALGPALLIGAGVATLTSGGMYLSSNSKYNSYKDFANPNRESDYNAAQNRLDIAVVTAGLAAAAVVTFIIYKITKKDKEKTLEQKKIRVSLGPFPASGTGRTSGRSQGIGLVYRF